MRSAAEEAKAFQEERLKLLKRQADNLEGLIEHENWSFFKELVQGEMERLTPKPGAFGSQEEAIKITSQMVFVQGMRAVLDVAEGAKGRYERAKQKG